MNGRELIDGSLLVLTVNGAGFRSLRYDKAGQVAGCGTSTYCPASVVMRGPMAKFLARTFHIP